MSAAEQQQDDGTVAIEEPPNDEFSWPPLESNPDVFTVRRNILHAAPLITTYTLYLYIICKRRNFTHRSNATLFPLPLSAPTRSVILFPEIPPLGRPPIDLLHRGNLRFRRGPPRLRASAGPRDHRVLRAADTQIGIPSAGPGLSRGLRQGVLLHASVGHARQCVRDHRMPPRRVQLAVGRCRPRVCAREVPVRVGIVVVADGEVRGPREECGISKHTQRTRVRGSIRIDHERSEQGQASFRSVRPRQGRERPRGTRRHEGGTGDRGRGVRRGPAPGEHSRGDGEVGTRGDIRIAEHDDSQPIPGMNGGGWTRPIGETYRRNCAQWIIRSRPETKSLSGNSNLIEPTIRWHVGAVGLPIMYRQT